MLKALLPAFLMVAATQAWAQDDSAASQSQTSTTTTETRSGHEISPGGLFIEPILQASREDAQIKSAQIAPGLENTSGKTEGAGLGLKLGVHVSEIFFLGVDGRYSREKFTDSSYSSANGDLYNYGPTAGIQMPWAGLRLFGTYVMGGQFDPAAGAGGVDLRFRDPRGTRVGVGLHIASVSVNLEYEDLNYSNTDIQSLGPINTNASTDIGYENKGYAVSLSFPVEL